MLEEFDEDEDGVMSVEEFAQASLDALNDPESGTGLILYKGFDVVSDSSLLCTASDKTSSYMHLTTSLQ